MTRKTPCTIRVRKETIKRLQKIGRYGESYDDIIKRLLPTKHHLWLDDDQEIIEEPPRERRIIKQKPIVGKPTKTNVQAKENDLDV